jgi:hypothetical protein
LFLVISYVNLQVQDFVTALPNFILANVELAISTVTCLDYLMDAGVFPQIYDTFINANLLPIFAELLVNEEYLDFGSLALKVLSKVSKVHPASVLEIVEPICNRAPFSAGPDLLIGMYCF